MSGIRIVVRTTHLSESEFADVCDQLFNFVVGISPVDTGYFVSQWEMDVSYPRCVLDNATPYASFLDNGWSKQAPNGITKPAISFLQELINGYSE